MQNQTALAATLYNPSSVHVTPTGEVFFSDMGNQRIRKILKNGSIVTIGGGSSYFYDGVNATGSLISNPFGVFVSDLGEVFISENRKIRRINIDGFIETVIGNGRSYNDGELASNSAVYYLGNCIKYDNELFYAEHGIHKIKKIDRSGKVVTVVGNGSVQCIDSVQATNSGLYGAQWFHISDGRMYISDNHNHRIRMVDLSSGIITTIAGTGTAGFSGDDGLATLATIKNPGSIHAYRGEVYFVDGGCRIRKILNNGNIITIAGTAMAGFNGDGIAKDSQISPNGLFVSKSGIHFADKSNRIRKISWNGMLTTIAGNGQGGFSGDIPFDIKLHPHFGLNFELLKHERDAIANTELIGFLPLIQKRAPKFHKFLITEAVVSQLSETDIGIVQMLIDGLIYGKDFCENEGKYEFLDILHIVGYTPDSELAELKSFYISEFINYATVSNLPKLVEKIEEIIVKTEKFGGTNYIIKRLLNYCFEMCAISLKSSSNIGLLNEASIIRNQGAILSKVHLERPSPLSLDVNEQLEDIQQLYNEQSSMDVRIKLGGNRFLNCHKTVLASGSSFFKSMFESGIEFEDLRNNIFCPQQDVNLKVLELIVKYCYRILDQSSNIEVENVLPLIDMAILHEIPYLINLCDSKLIVTNDNFFLLADQFRVYVNVEAFGIIFDRIVDFAVKNRKTLLTSVEKVAQLPTEMHVAIITKISQL